MFKILVFQVLLFLITGILSVTHAEKIRNLTTIEGVRDNQLIGYGLVVGLNGTGDHSSQVSFTTQTLNNMLSQLGIKIPVFHNNNFQLKNVAAVIVTAKLPPFGLQGEKVNVCVSSIGNSTSLEGGILLMTPLKGMDSKIYAVAQGKVLVNKSKLFSITGNKLNFIPQLNQLNSGIVNCGGIIEREIKNYFNDKKIIVLQLYKENYALANKISEVINDYYTNIAAAMNSKSIVIITKSFNNNERVNILSHIQNIDIIMNKLEPKIIINSKIGSVIINNAIQLHSCSVTYKNFTIFINNKQKKYFYQLVQNSNNKLKYFEYNKISDSNSDNMILTHIVHTLNMFRITPIELMSILESMKKSNCLFAKLESL